MSIYYSGTFKRSGGLISAITKQLKILNLKPVKKIEVQFDPFHPKALTARDFLCHVSSEKVIKTNYTCVIRGTVVCDRSEPVITVNLGDAGTLKFLANNLSVLEILQQLNKHVLPLVPEETEAVTIKSATQTRKKKK